MLIAFIRSVGYGTSQWLLWTSFNSFGAIIAHARREKVRRYSATCRVSTKRRKTLAVRSKYSTNKGL